MEEFGASELPYIRLSRIISTLIGSQIAQISILNAPQ